MASSSHPLFTSSLRLPTNPLISKQFYSNNPKFQSFYLIKKPHYRFLSSPAAVATDPSTAINDKNVSDDVTKELQKVVLPTNQSSQTLLRIRHTVNLLAFLLFAKFHEFIAFRLLMSKLVLKKCKIDMNLLMFD